MGHRSDSYTEKLTLFPAKSTIWHFWALKAKRKIVDSATFRVLGRKRCFPHSHIRQRCAQAEYENYAAVS